MKKWVSVLLSTAMMLSMAACAGSATPPQDNVDAPAQQSAENNGSAQPAASSEKKLIFWDMPWGDSNYTLEAKNLCEQYTAETGQEVEYQQIPWDGWVQVFVTAATSNTGPDVTTGGALLQHRLALMDEIEPLDDLASSYSADEFVNGTLENFRYNGKQIAIPYNCDFRAMYYRTDLFDAAGITELPTNWDEFYEIAKLLTHDDQYGYVTAGSDVSGHWSALFWSVSNGGSYLDSSMNPNMANPANIEAFDFLRSMYVDGIIPPGATGYTGPDAEKLFYQGKAAMIMGAPTIGAQAPDEVRDVISVMPPFASPAGLTQNVGSTNGIMLLSDSEMKDEGKLFIDWFSKNSISLWSKGGQGPFPARISLMEDEFFQTDKFKKQFSDLIVPNTVLLTYPHTEASVEMDIMDGEQFYRDVIQKLYSSKETSQSILEEADERYAKALDQMRKSAA